MVQLRIKSIEILKIDEKNLTQIAISKQKNEKNHAKSYFSMGYFIWM